MTKLAALLLAAALLGGCMLVSGGRSTADTQPGAGSISASFVGAEGTEERELAVGAPGAAVNVVMFVALDQGELRLELLDPSGSVVLSTQGRPGERVTRSGSLRADDQGRVRYRVVARGARKGSYELFYQIA